jgi:putative ABC transport system permease protein
MSGQDRVATIREWLARLRGMFRRREFEDRLDAELQLHRELLAEELAASDSRSGSGIESEPGSDRRSSMTPERKLGGASFRDEYYDRVGVPWLENGWRDVRYGLRLLRRAPGFAAVSVLTIALGIGGSTAMFCLLYHIVLKPLAYPDAARLAVVWGIDRESGRSSTSLPDYQDFRAQNRSFAQLAGWARRRMNVVSPGAPDAVVTAEVSDNFFATIGVAPLLGRVLMAADAQEPIVVLSHAVWVNRFAADPAAIGRAIVLDDVPHTIVGVMPPGFDVPSGSPLWKPFGVKTRSGGRRDDSLGLIGRLRPDVAIEQADAELHAMAARLERAYPGQNAGRGVEVRRRQEDMTRETRMPLIVLFSAVSLLLAIACVNIALLMLARGAARRAEVVMRAALGASRARLMTQLLTESLIVSAIGTALGVAAAYASLRAWLEWGAPALPRVQEITIDGVVLGFASATALACTLLFSLLPIRRALRFDLSSDLHSRGGGASAASGRSMRWLVGAQALLATLLIIGAGLLVRSLDALMHVDPGYRAEGVLTARVSLSNRAYADGQAVARFHERLLDRLRTLPGVASAALATAPPAAGGNDQTFRIEGQPASRDRTPTANLRAATEDYLRTVGTPLLAGRNLAASDGPDAPRVALVSRALAQRYFAGRDPLGARLAIDGDDWRTIVGVMADVRQDGVDAPSYPEVLVPMAQRRTRGPVALVRTTAAVDAASMAATIRAVVSEIDPRLPLTDVATLDTLRDTAIQQPKFRTSLLAAFAAVALLLVSLGIYGMTSYAVSRRAPEFGLRIALGATRGSIGALVLRTAGGLALLGIVCGLALAAAGARAIGSLLFGIEAHDAVTFVAAPLIVALVCIAAALVPARRAASVDPVEALRAK